MIHALPGMGADHRMYPEPWSRIPGFQAHGWVRHRGEQSISEVARSMCATCGIEDGDMLVGASLGGMVACEMTKIRKIPVLFLVGSARRKEEVSGLLTSLHPLARVAPVDWLRFSAGKIPGEFAQMFAGIEASFVRAMCTAIFEWEGLASSPTRIVRIHGRRDLVITPPEEVDLLLDAGHLVSITHAEECAEFVRATVLRSAVS
jgi:pimeloyl-ACP methyl ester carboxylesterase